MAFVAVLVLANLAPAFAQAQAAPAPTSRDVLVLEAGAAGRPVSNAATAALAAAFEPSGPNRLQLYHEWLDQERFPGPAQLELVRDHLARKYAGRPPAVVVALADLTVPFAIEARDRLWPDAAIVAVATSVAMVQQVAAVPRAVAMPMIYDVGGTVRTALALLPDTDTIALVAAGDGSLPRVEAALAADFPSLRVLRLVDLPLDEVQRRIATLPPRTVILYSQYARDPAGRAYVSRHVLTDLAPRTNRPVLGYAPTYFGHGITAGSIHDFTRVALDLSRVVRALLDGTPLDRIDARVTPPLPHVDARELARWRIPESRVPAGSVVAYRTPTLWSQYRGAVLTGSAVMAVQAALIAALLVEQRRRRTADMHARTLSIRLFTAQEEERRRIARELHDGANQELALFAMQLDQTGHQALGDRARALATDLHRLSHELHPALLDQLGLVPALQQFADQLAAGRAVDIEVRTSQWPSSVPPAIAAALYRVAQEALQNVVRHSGARHAVVHLQATEADLTMSVTDAGAGFLAGDDPTAGIGLAGMRERLLAIGGTLMVESAPGAGTTVVARVPRARLAEWRDDPVTPGVEAPGPAPSAQAR